MCINCRQVQWGVWATVEEYLQCDLASDSNDKRLRKAQQCVRQKQNFKKKGYKTRFNPYFNKQHQPQQSFQPSFQPNFVQNSRPFNNFPRQGAKQNSKCIMGCFICGDLAHWKDACPGTGTFSRSRCFSYS